MKKFMTLLVTAALAISVPTWAANQTANGSENLLQAEVGNWNLTSVNEGIQGAGLNDNVIGNIEVAGSWEVDPEAIGPQAKANIIMGKAALYVEMAPFIAEITPLLGITAANNGGSTLKMPICNVAQGTENALIYGTGGSILKIPVGIIVGTSMHQATANFIAGNA